MTTRRWTLRLGCLTLCLRFVVVDIFILIIHISHCWWRSCRNTWAWAAFIRNNCSLITSWSFRICYHMSCKADGADDNDLDADWCAYAKRSATCFYNTMHQTKQTAKNWIVSFHEHIQSSNVKFTRSSSSFDRVTVTMSLLRTRAEISWLKGFSFSELMLIWYDEYRWFDVNMYLWRVLDQLLLYIAEYMIALRTIESL